MVDVWLPYGKTDVCVRVPARNLLGTIESAERQGVPDAKAEVERALKEPIPVGSKHLSEIAKPESKVAIVVDDATRKTPTETDAFASARRTKSGWRKRREHHDYFWLRNTSSS